MIKRLLRTCEPFTYCFIYIYNCIVYASRSPNLCGKVEGRHFPRPLMLATVWTLVLKKNVQLVEILHHIQVIIDLLKVIKQYEICFIIISFLWFNSVLIIKKDVLSIEFIELIINKMHNLFKE